NEPATSKNLFSEKIEVQVGSEIITTTDLQLMEDAIKAEQPSVNSGSVPKMAKDAAVDQKLISNYLNQINFPVTDKDVDQRINSIRSAKGIQNSDQFRSLVEASGLTFDRFRAQVKLQMEKMQFMNVVRRSASHTPDETELRAYYKNNADQFQKNIQIDLSECVIPLGKNPKETEEKAAGFINKPKQFDTCVKKESQSPSAAKGGHIGTFGWGVLPEDVEAKVYHLKQGEVAMVRQPGAIQLLKVTKVKDLGPVSFEVAQEKIRERLESEILQKELQKTLSDLRSTTFISSKTKS
ncbi:MAG: PpiC-type peptidyl-prolyl cis-trans isomerase, partial [Bacteriovoracaceae bacterium]|nr:PpiC-type peptidyl-prolyl cis-trans isomerase [Bacteriovoracaceae bacterium]